MVTFTVNGISDVFSVASTSCADARQAATQWHAANGYPSYSAVSCSTPSIEPGTVISFTPSGSWSISSVVADGLAMDWSSVSLVLQVVYWTFLFYIAISGYNTGSRSAI